METNYFLVSHNDFCHGLKHALEMIAGPQPNVYSFGLMPGSHPSVIAAQITEQMKDGKQAVILGDLAGGSVCNEMLSLTCKPNVVLVAGTNLGLALQVVLSGASTAEEIDACIDEAKAVMKRLIVENCPVDDQDGDFFD